MNFAELSHRTTQFCFGLVIGLAVLLSGCGGGGGGIPTASLSSITILPSSTSVAPIYVAQGQTVRLTAKAKYSDGTTADISAQVTWTSVSPLVASVVSPGVVTGVAVTGSTTITAKLNGVTSIPANITVTGVVVPTLGLATSRWDHAANLLPASGVAAEMVLVAGGYTGDGTTLAALDSSELYDTSIAGANKWIVTGRLNIPRGDHTSTRLQNGQVLVAGGANDTDSNIARSELFDPNTRSWTLTAGNLVEGRSYHTSTLLADGTVLIVGGAGVTSPSLNSSELYDPATDHWTATTGSLASGRYSHTATLLGNGTVLVMGGVNVAVGNATYLASSELYHPGTKNWSSAVSLNIGRFSHTATLLTAAPNAGKVLVMGGVEFSTGKSTTSVELCDPASVPPAKCTALPPLNIARALHSATLLTTGPSAGKILVMYGDDFNGNELSSIELYDPTATPISSILQASVPPPRDNFTATLLSTGSVLAVGGFDGTASLSTTDLH